MSIPQEISRPARTVRVRYREVPENRLFRIATSQSQVQISAFRGEKWLVSYVRSVRVVYFPPNTIVSLRSSKTSCDRACLVSNPPVGGMREVRKQTSCR